MSTRQRIQQWVILAWCAMAGGLPGVVMAQGPLVEPSAGQRLVVFDSQGMPIGNAVVYGPTLNDLAVMFQFGEHLVGLGVMPEGFRPSDDALAYAAADCSGPPLLLTATGAPAAGFFALRYFHLPGATLYVPAVGAVMQEVHIGAFRLFDGGCLPLEGWAWAMPAVLVGDVLTQFIPPFTVVLDEPMLADSHTHTVRVPKNVAAKKAVTLRTGLPLP